MSGQPDKPLWRKTFDKAERAVGGRLEEMIETRQFADAMSMTARVRKTVSRQVYGNIHRTLHIFGLTSLKDTRALARQLNRVEAQLREMTSQLDALEEQKSAADAEKEKRRPQAARAASSGRRRQVDKPLKQVNKPIKKAPRAGETGEE